VLFVRFCRRPGVRRSADVGGLQVKVTDAGTGLELNLKPDLAGAVHRHRTGADKSGCSRVCCAPRSRPTAFSSKRIPKLRPVESGQRRRVPSWPGALAALHRRDHRARQGSGRPSRDHSLARQARHRGTGGQGRSEGCVACATCVKVCPYGAPHESTTSRRRKSRAPPAWAGGSWRGGMSGAYHHPATPRGRADDGHARRAAVVGEAHDEPGSSRRGAPRRPVSGNPRSSCFCCNFCAYAAADLAGRTAHAIPRPTCAWCTCPAPARSHSNTSWRPFEKGIDGVLIAGCLEGALPLHRGQPARQAPQRTFARHARRDRRGPRATAHGEPVGRHGADLRPAGQRNRPRRLRVWPQPFEGARRP